MGLRLLDAQGQFAGAIDVGMSADVLRRLMTPSLPTGVRVALLDARSTSVGAFPPTGDPNALLASVRATENLRKYPFQVVIEQTLDAALGHIEPRGEIRQPMIAAGIGHRVEEREAMGKLRLDDAHVIGTSFHQG